MITLLRKGDIDMIKPQKRFWSNVHLPFLYLFIRHITKPAWLKRQCRTANRIYCWADWKINCAYTNRLPSALIWFYQCLSCGCNFIAAINTVDSRTLRSKLLQRAIDRIIHRVPLHIRFGQIQTTKRGYRHG